jgi:hypothetical protein
VSPQLHFTTSQGFSHHPNAIGRARLQQLLADADVRRRATGRDTSTIPMVMVAVFADQPANASRVVQAGASLLITQAAGSANDRAYLDRDAVRELRIALDSVLTQDRFRDAARNVAHQSNAAPDVAAVLSTALGDSSAVSGPQP